MVVFPAKKGSSASVLSVLIVEDVDSMRSMLVHLFEEIPEIEVSGVARNGAEARMEISRRRPDAILLDEVIPGESSLDLLKEFSAAGIPIWLMTGMESPLPEIPPPALGRLIKPGWKSIDEDRKRFKAALLKK